MNKLFLLLSSSLFLNCAAMQQKIQPLKPTLKTAIISVTPKQNQKPPDSNHMRTNLITGFTQVTDEYQVSLPMNGLGQNPYTFEQKPNPACMHYHTTDGKNLICKSICPKGQKPYIKLKHNIKK